jgi:hypothetical protein
MNLISILVWSLSVVTFSTTSDYFLYRNKVSLDVPRKKTIESEERRFEEYMKELNRIPAREERKFRKKQKEFEDEFRSLW